MTDTADRLFFRFLQRLCLWLRRSVTKVGIILHRGIETVAFLISATTLLRILCLLRCTHNSGFKRLFTPKRIEPRIPFFYTSKYQTWRFKKKKIKLFSSRVFQIFDSKHGSPENYSDFFCFSSSSRSRALRSSRSSRHNFSKILLNNQNEILQTSSWVNVLVSNTFWVHSVQGFWS